MKRFNQETIDGVTFTVCAEQDDLQVRGNALASGNDEADRECEDGIIARLDRGDIWAWASVRVEASIEVGGVELSADDYLGGCSYADVRDFMQPGGYYDDMKANTRGELVSKLQAIAKEIAGVVESLSGVTV